MFSCVHNVLFSVITFIIVLQTCVCELSSPQASLYLYSPGELEYTEVLVRRVNDNLTLVCELRGDSSKRDFVWNFMPGNNGSAGGSPQPLATEPLPEAPHRSMMMKYNLTPADTGRYMCSSPPFSQTKFILVQTTTVKHCARSAFVCGQRCVLPAYLCDGFPDCLLKEDEAPALCRDKPCQGAGRLNCSSGRCVSAAACCGAAPLCRQPACCDEHARYSRLQASLEDFPMPPEDRHAPDDYGFIQSTIYTVTACALIFMIAVVLLVSAICKMHMKRAALRSYAAAERATRSHYSAHYAQTHRFPPCYESSRLLDEPRAQPASPHDSPSRLAVQCAVEAPNSPEAGFGLGRLSDIFSSRYRQVPTQCCEVEMQSVRARSLNSSPTRPPPAAYCDLNSAEFYFSNPAAGDCGRELNSMGTPVELVRGRSVRRNTLERALRSLGARPRPFTLQLGRFQLSIPKFGRRASTERRPDTPNVAEIDIDDLDFVRLDSDDTYTLNGRTIRLLGANFENYPVLSDGSIRPPPYTEAVRYKLYGPPPEYLSRDALNRNNVDEEARSNVEMPPNYDELASTSSSSAATGANSISVVPGTSANAGTPTSGTGISNTNAATTINGNSVIGNEPSINNINNNDSPNTSSADNNSNICTVSCLKPSISSNNNTCSDMSQPSTSNSCNNNVVESIKAVIDNLPAIDSDVNANEAEA